MSDVIIGRVISEAEYAAANAPRAAAPRPDRDTAALEQYAEHVHANWRTWTPAQCAAAGRRVARLARLEREAGG